MISNSESGFIALISTIIISILLLAITVNLGFSGFFARFNILDSESKERSLALAEACVDSAILKITQNASYNPLDEIVTVGTDQCTIISVDNVGSNQKMIKTQATINKAFTNLKVVIDRRNFTIVLWEECAIGPCS